MTFAGKNYSLTQIMMAGAVLLIAFTIVLEGYIEATDPCTQWVERGTNIIDTGGGYAVRPNMVCVARRSGWHE